MPTVSGLERAIASTSASISSSSASSRTTRLTRPQSSAVAASIGWPVSSMSSARLRPIARESGTIGVEQNRPIFTPGVAKSALSAATARSQAATSWQPAAVAVPCTLAMTGCGSRWIVSISSVQTSNSRWKNGTSRPIISLRSWPAENAGPAASRTIARVSGSALTRRNTAVSSSISSRLSALRFSGRLRVTRTAGPSWRTSTVAPEAIVLMAPRYACRVTDQLAHDPVVQVGDTALALEDPGALQLDLLGSQALEQPTPLAEEHRDHVDLDLVE